MKLAVIPQMSVRRGLQSMVNQLRRYYSNTTAINKSTQPTQTVRTLTQTTLAASHPYDAGFCCSYHRGEYLKRQTILGKAETLPQANVASFSSSTPSTTATLSDPVFSIETPPIRFGRGALDELGAACTSLNLKRVMLLTDKNIVELEWYQRAVNSMKACKIEVIEYSDVSVEPTLNSLLHAADFAAKANVDGFVSIGGGSVIDTAKAANLYSCAPPPDADPLAYVNVPIGRGLFPSKPIKPHISCPTTAGTGSETTGIAIFDHEAMGVKTGIAHRGLRPSMAIIDPTTQDTIPATVCASSGFDVLSHALESYTAKLHSKRTTTARTPYERFFARPMSQGSNAWANHGCLSALRLLGNAILPAYHGDRAARDDMMLASTMAGIAFGNVGVHLPHAMSYAVSGGVQSFHAEDYNLSQGAIVPHGMSVILNAPAVFRWTAPHHATTHLEAARALGCPAVLAGKFDAKDAPMSEVGEALAEHLISLMKATKMPNGLNAVGYTDSDLPQLVSGTMAQQRLLNNLDTPLSEAQLKQIFRNAMKYW